jgi:hypothetical protein
MRTFQIRVHRKYDLSIFGVPAPIKAFCSGVAAIRSGSKSKRGAWGAPLLAEFNCRSGDQR